MLQSNSWAANCPAADAARPAALAAQASSWVSSSQSLDCCSPALSTFQLPNPALPPGQPEQSEIQVEGRALADDIMAAIGRLVWGERQISQLQM